MKIPQIIHYCWFGKNKKTKLIDKCILSWKKHFPDYKIIEWNESNFDIDSQPYVKEAYKCQKWAYVSDYVRFFALYNYGGIYFDTDVEVIKSFPDEILCLASFSGIEGASGLISPGLVYACQPGDGIVKKILDSYENDMFIQDKPEKILTINKRTTSILDDFGYIHEDKKQQLGDLTVFPNDFFCGYDGEKRRPLVTSNTLSIHHYAASWLPWYRKIRLKIGTVLRHWRYRNL